MTVTEPIAFLVVEDFLSEEEHETLLSFVRGDEVFSPAKVTLPGETEGAPDAEYRKAKVGEAVEQVFDLFEDKLHALLPHARRETGVPHFNVGIVERQLTAHDGGDFFGAHTDIGDPYGESGGRRLSYVYYFHEAPRTFEGGELLLYDHVVHPDGRIEIADTFQTIEPTDNSIVFFASNALHEVRPVTTSAEPGSPGSTRFTVNGWFRDRDHVRPGPLLDPPARTALCHRYTPNFTATGFKKIETPAAVHRAMREIYDERYPHRHVEQADEVHLPSGVPDFIDIDDVKGQFQFALQSIHEDWAGVELVPTAAYRLRVYRAGQTLIPHTDRLPTHVVSSIVHIAHETNEPWPLWILDVEGNEHEVVLEEGEMLLYESAKCPHARPYPLDGETYCSLFLHYQPVDWTLTDWSLVDMARAEGATDLLPPELWPTRP